ncbi:hypothetical protein KAI65_05570 [Candidatus Parcubacteria bacterium]|nr:hypothetical protein [Candidatus Parcubacteria bacterium]
MKCSELHKILRKGNKFNFKSGKNFQNYLKQYKNFPENGIYLMTEKGEIGHVGLRIVRIGINKKNSLVKRLNKHINGSENNSIFREHIRRIFKKEESLITKDDVTEYIKNKISFYVIRDLENKREILERKIIGTISKCGLCMSSNSWKGLESATERIRESGLWNVHYVCGEYQLDKDDMDYIKKNLLK